MRIAYVSLHWPRSLESGVGKKINQQIKCWREFGHEVQFYMHMPADVDLDNLVPGVTSTYRAIPGFAGKARTEINRVMAADRLLPMVNEFKPDLIYLRWGMYVFPAHLLFKIAPTVMEINTNDVSQHGLLGTVYGSYNRLTRGIFLRGVSGLVSASRELAIAPEFANYAKATCIITNGIDLAETRPISAPNNPIPRLVFIGTPGFPWHGVDKLVDLARNFPDIVVDLIGYDRLEGIDTPPDNLHIHGYLASEAYQKILARADVGIGTLALHRKGMEEASPLKTRECLAHGIPMVIPYLDSDLQNYENPCLLRIPNREDNLIRCGQQIRDFAYAMRGRRIPIADLAGRIDIKVKETERLTFFKQCLVSIGRNMP